MWLDEIKTRFVRDRVREVSWKERQYIYDLRLIERIFSGPALGFAFGMSGAPKRLHAAYPAESECIRLEIREGRYVDPDSFHENRAAFTADWAAERQAQAERAASDEAARQRRRDEDRLAELRQERDTWLVLGGRP